MKSLIKKIPQIKKICDDRDKFHQLMLDAQYELEQLRHNFISLENELSVKTDELSVITDDLERVHKQYNVMEEELQFERQLVAEKTGEFERVLKQYNLIEADLHYERKLVAEKTDELERIQHKYNESADRLCDNEVMEFKEYSFWINDYFVNDVVNNKQDYLDLYNMLDDDESKKIFNWIVGYRVVCSLLYEPMLWEAKKPSKLYELIPCTTSLDTFYETYGRAMDDKTSCLHAETYCIWHTFYLEHYRYDELFTINDGDVVFDIGGFVGDTALYFSRKVKSGHVYTFEPDSKHISKIQDNIKHFSINNISVIDKGVSDYSGTAEFSKFGASGGAVKDAGEQQIEVIELDKFVEDNNIFFSNRVDIIKMDIEGSELDALRGAENVIRDFRPVLLISVYHTRFQDNSDYAIKPGYGDLLPVSLYAKEICTGYKFSLRHKNCSLFETLLICVPQEKYL